MRKSARPLKTPLAGIWTVLLLLGAPGLGGETRLRAEMPEAQAPAPAENAEKPEAAGAQQKPNPQQTPTKPQIVRDVPFANVGGEKLLADVFLPAGSGPFPGVLLIHGGGWALGDKSEMARIGRRLAERGYAAVSINYRLAPKHKFPAQIDDCRRALAWMRGQAATYKIDPSWLAVFGYSAGGHLAALLATTERDAARAPDQAADGDETAPDDRNELPPLRAVVAGGAPCDFSQVPPEQIVLNYWLGATRAERPEVYQQASPASFASPDDPPAFFYHGEEDNLVPCELSAVLARRLAAIGVPAETYIVPGAGHIRAFFDRAAIEAAIRFLDRIREAGAAQPNHGLGNDS